MAEKVAPITHPNIFGAMKQAAADNRKAVANFSWDAGEDARWRYVDDFIDGTRWDKYFPYQLMVLRRAEGAGGESTYKVLHTFTLPIPPADLKHSLVFANVTDATLGGISETHNGIPIQPIEFAGSFGVAPLRGSVAGVTGESAPIVGLFLGTVNAATGVAEAAQTLASPTLTRPNLMGEDDATLTGTGYYQHLLLERFLSSYALAKKNGQNDLRLGFAVWKEQRVFLVTPQVYTSAKAAGSPMKKNYQFSLKAWGSVFIEGTGPGYSVPVTENVLKEVLSKVEAADAVVRNSQNLIGAAINDLKNLILDPIREVSLLASDTLGLATTLLQLPTSLLRAGSTLESAVLSQWDTIRKQATYLDDVSHIDPLTSLTNQPTTRGGNQQPSDRPAQQQQAVSATASNSSKLPYSPFSSDDAYKWMSKVSVNSLPIPGPTLRAIETEKARVRNLSELDLKERAQKLSDAEATLASVWGVDEYDQPVELSADQWSILYSLSEAAEATLALAAQQTKKSTLQPRLNFYADLARTSGIAFTVPTSKFPVPVPFGSTMESLAKQYLGDPDRWLEIAELNGLQEPYIDEDGFYSELLVNAAEDHIFVHPGKWFIGQQIRLSSNTVLPKFFKVLDLKETGLGTKLVLDASPAEYQTKDVAMAHGFLPYTTNSQRLLYIPSEDTVPDSGFFIEDIPGINEDDPYVQVGGVDFLLTEAGDLAVDSNGDQKLAYGLTNIVQKLRIALRTKRGTLPHFPDYGNGLVVGANTDTVDVRGVRDALSALIRNDPTFSGLENVAVKKSGPGLQVHFEVRVAQTGRSIPLDFNV